MAYTRRKRKTQTKVAPSLPIDIISIILALLPVVYLVRFKIVSKAWYKLISSLHFSYQHLNSQPSHYEDRIFLFVGKDRCLYFSSLEIHDSFNPTKLKLEGYSFQDILGSCNGLLLCSCLGKSNKNMGLVLVNPSTLQHKLISKSEPSIHIDWSYGFGYDFKDDDYKVVMIVSRIVTYDLQRRIEVEMYSSKSNSWKSIDHDFSNGIFLRKAGVLINNHMLHWLFYSNVGRVIWSFDVCIEQWSQVSLPALYICSNFYERLKVFDGRLCLLAHRKESGMFMKDAYSDGESWVNFFDCPDSIPYPLSYSKSRHEILVVAGHKLFWYHMPRNISREVECHQCVYFFSQPIVCTRSLVLLPGCG